jgi:hypothetical protein
MTVLVVPEGTQALEWCVSPTGHIQNVFICQDKKHLRKDKKEAPFFDG